MTDGPPAHRHENAFDQVDASRGRRAFLQLGGAAIAAVAIPVNRNSGGSGHAPTSIKQRSTERLVRRLFRAIESGSTSAIWAFFARDGAIEFPFLGTRYTDFESFDAELGPVLAAIPDLTFTDPDFEFLDDPEALIAKYDGHAVVTFNGKSYDQKYITEIHTRHGKITSYTEYFDTAVLIEAFTP
jgi:ketosteroid isomerase-like protein